MKYYALFASPSGHDYAPVTQGSYENCLTEFSACSGPCYIVEFQNENSALSGCSGTIVKMRERD